MNSKKFEAAKNALAEIGIDVALVKDWYEDYGVNEQDGIEFRNLSAGVELSINGNLVSIHWQTGNELKCSHEWELYRVFTDAEVACIYYDDDPEDEGFYPLDAGPITELANNEERKAAIKKLIKATMPRQIDFKK